MSRVFLLTSSLVTNLGDLKKSAVHNGLLYIGSWLKNRGHEVFLFHTEFEGWNNVRHEDEGTVEYGADDEIIVERIKEFAPDVIGLSLVATVSYSGFLNVSQLIKRHFHDVPLVVGGAHATALPEKTLRESEADYLVEGEGEIVMEGIVNHLDNPQAIRALPGVAYLDGNVFVENPREALITDLDMVGDLRLELLKETPFTAEPTYGGTTNGRKYLDVFFSRGCLHNCDFCFSPQMWQRKVRHHSLGWIQRQVGRMVVAGYRHLLIQDDNFSRLGDWSVEVMKILHEAKISWEENGGLEMENLTSELVFQMKELGATTLFVPFNLRTNSKDKIPERLWAHYLKVLKAAKECGLVVYTSQIIGFPGVSVKEMIEQVARARQLREKDLSFFHMIYVASLLPGTRNWNRYMEPVGHGDYRVRDNAGIIFRRKWDYWADYSIHSAQLGDGNFTADEMAERARSWMFEVNGERANAWYAGREWPK